MTPNSFYDLDRRNILCLEIYMLSDSLFEATEMIWEAVKEYDYSSDFKYEIVHALVDLTYITYQLDRLKVDCIWTREDMERHILRRWSEEFS